MATRIISQTGTKRRALSRPSLEPILNAKVEQEFIREPLVQPLLTALRGKEPAERVTVLESIGGTKSRQSLSIGELISSLEAIEKRQVQGFFTVEEAAQILADAHSAIDVRMLIAQLSDAMVGTYDQRRRLVRSIDLLPLAPGVRVREFLNLVSSLDVDEWLKSLSVPFLLSPLCGMPQSSMQGSMDVRDSAGETVVQRRKRRLARFQELGGKMIKVPGAWHVDKEQGKRGALARLIDEEQALGVPRKDGKSVREDLAAAYALLAKGEL